MLLSDKILQVRKALLSAKRSVEIFSKKYPLNYRLLDSDEEKKRFIKTLQTFIYRDIKDAYWSPVLVRTDIVDKLNEERGKTSMYGATLINLREHVLTAWIGENEIELFMIVEFSRKLRGK